jgi:tetratricopeptide (TPR) repeat protein
LLGDRDRELSDLSRAIELEPDDPQLRHRRALIFMLRREHARAIADYDRIIAVKPDANAYLFRGGAHLYSGNYDQAIADAEHAINLDPGNAVARDLLREASKKKAEAQTRS